jgi:hypothetical protein
MTAPPRGCGRAGLPCWASLIRDGGARNAMKRLTVIHSINIETRQTS